MGDIFNFNEAALLLKNKYLIFIGDSNMRAQYKDLIWLLNANTVIEQNQLKRKLEKSFLGDTLIERSELHRGRDFREVRSYESKKQNIRIDFLFTSICFDHYLQQTFNEIKNKKTPTPSVVVMNSCLWDLTRWGPDGAILYKTNMKKLMSLFKECLPVSTLVIWSTALPVASQIRCGLLIKQIEFLKHTLRFEVMEGNNFARDIVGKHGYDVLDIHHYMRFQVHRRSNDGVHYFPLAVRYMTNMILTHIALSWGTPLPGRVHNNILNRLIALEHQDRTPHTEERLLLLDSRAKNMQSVSELSIARSTKRTVQILPGKQVPGGSFGPQREKRRFGKSRKNPY